MACVFRFKTNASLGEEHLERVGTVKLKEASP